MNPPIKALVLGLAAFALAVPAAVFAAGPPGDPHGKDKGKTTTAPAGASLPGPGASASVSTAQAYGFHCRNQSKQQVEGQKGTPFSQCVTAMAKAATGAASSAKAACATVAKQHVVGQKGTPYSQCVTEAAKVLKSRRAHGLTLDRKAILPNACNGAGTTLLVNVTFTLKNDADSGFAGNAWANDTIHRTLRIWKQADGSYCAVVGDTGSFVTSAGTSPNKTGDVTAGIKGRLQGGYVATFTGTPVASPAYADHGGLGTFDLQCDADFNCPGAHPSFTSYVDPTPTASSYTLTAWGWIYRTAKHGTWVNQSSGSSGDITG